MTSELTYQSTAARRNTTLSLSSIFQGLELTYRKEASNDVGVKWCRQKKSTTGYYLKLFRRDGALSLGVKQQVRFAVALSWSEEEYEGITKAVQQALCLL